MELSRGGVCPGAAPRHRARPSGGAPRRQRRHGLDTDNGGALPGRGGSPVLVSGVLPALAAPAGGAGRAVALLPAWLRRAGRAVRPAGGNAVPQKGPRKAGTGPSAPLASDTGAVRHAASAVPDIGQSFRPGERRGAPALAGGSAGPVAALPACGGAGRDGALPALSAPAGGGPARQSAQPDPRRQAGAAGCL
mgnify:CR=1 FL=1